MHFSAAPAVPANVHHERDQLQAQRCQYFNLFERQYARAAVKSTEERWLRRETVTWHDALLQLTAAHPQNAASSPLPL